MRLNRLDLNLLIALDALLTERSITRAAERIHLSQPATSGALARLRDYFEDDLLTRVGTKMKPTPLGESLRTPVHNILMQIQATVSRPVDFDAAKSTRCFRLVVSDYMATTLFPVVSRAIAPIAPNISFDLYAPADDPLTVIDQGEVDFLIMPEHLTHPEHPHIPLYKEQIVCIAWAENPLIQDGFTLDHFMKLGHVGTKFGSLRKRSLDHTIMREQKNICIDLEVTTPTFASIPHYVVGTNRLATIYRDLAEQWAKLLPLKILPMPVEIPTINWHIQWHTYRDADPGLKWLREQMLEIAQQNRPEYSMPMSA